MCTTVVMFNSKGVAYGKYTVCLLYDVNYWLPGNIQEKQSPASEISAFCAK